jgi:LuxR family transcriptional regulator, transcriptional regulator of spore coat protein
MVPRAKIIRVPRHDPLFRRSHWTAALRRSVTPEAGRLHLEEHMSIIELERTAPVHTANPLTRREQVVLSNLTEDITLEQIATKLFVTRNTVKSQVRSVYRKIGVSTRADAVAWARQAGINAA